MRKEFEIHGCIEVPPEMTEEEFWNRFIRFVEENGWSFGGGISEIRDGWYILPDGSRGSHVLDGEWKHKAGALRDTGFSAARISG